MIPTETETCCIRPGAEFPDADYHDLYSPVQVAIEEGQISEDQIPACPVSIRQPEPGATAHSPAGWNEAHWFWCPPCGVEFHRIVYPV